MKLNLEEKTALLDVATQPGFQIVLKQLDILIHDYESRLNGIDLRPGREKELCYEKARCEGAKRLRNGLAKALDILRKTGK